MSHGFQSIPDRTEHTGVGLKAGRAVERLFQNVFALQHPLFLVCF